VNGRATKYTSAAPFTCSQQQQQGHSVLQVLRLLLPGKHRTHCREWAHLSRRFNLCVMCCLALDEHLRGRSSCWLKFSQSGPRAFHLLQPTHTAARSMHDIVCKHKRNRPTQNHIFGPARPRSANLSATRDQLSCQTHSRRDGARRSYRSVCFGLQRAAVQEQQLIQWCGPQVLPHKGARLLHTAGVEGWHCHLPHHVVHLAGEPPDSGSSRCGAGGATLAVAGLQQSS
jgi:hypothetical protein